MGLQVGEAPISNAFVGQFPITKMLVGETQVYPSGGSGEEHTWTFTGRVEQKPTEGQVSWRSAAGGRKEFYFYPTGDDFWKLGNIYQLTHSTDGDLGELIACYVGPSEGTLVGFEDWTGNAGAGLPSSFYAEGETLTAKQVGKSTRGNTITWKWGTKSNTNYGRIDAGLESAQFWTFSVENARVVDYYNSDPPLWYGDRQICFFFEGKKIEMEWVDDGVSKLASFVAGATKTLSSSKNTYTFSISDFQGDDPLSMRGGTFVSYRQVFD